MSAPFLSIVTNTTNSRDGLDNPSHQIRSNSNIIACITYLKAH